MNIGQHMGGREKAYSAKARDIREANLLPEFVAKKKPAEERKGIENLSDADLSEFSPKRAVLFEAKVLEELEDSNRSGKLPRLDKSHFVPYLAAPNDFYVAKKLVHEFCAPVFKYAARNGRDLSHVKSMMRDAIAEHMDLTALKEASDRIRNRSRNLTIVDSDEERTLQFSKRANMHEQRQFATAA